MIAILFSHYHKGIHTVQDQPGTVDGYPDVQRAILCQVYQT